MTFGNLSKSKYVIVEANAENWSYNVEILLQKLAMKREACSPDTNCKLAQNPAEPNVLFSPVFSFRYFVEKSWFAFD